VSFAGGVAGTSGSGFMKSEGVLGLSMVEGLTASNALMKLEMDSFCASVARIAEVPNARVAVVDETAPNAAKRAAA
jgi:hypothetical protein